MELVKEGVLYIEEEPVYTVREVHDNWDKGYIVAFPISEESIKKYKYTHNNNDLEIPINVVSKTYLDFKDITNNATQVLTQKGFNKKTKRLIKKVAAPSFVSNLYPSQTDIISGTLKECFRIPAEGKPVFIGTNNIKWKDTYLTLDGFSEFLNNIVSDSSLEIL